MGKASPNRVDEHRIGGVYCRFEYFWKKHDVNIVPDEDDLRTAGVYEILRLWTVIANWSVRFVAANPGWTVNGSDPVERLDEDI
jgi:hypothetical protein